MIGQENLVGRCLGYEIIIINGFEVGVFSIGKMVFLR
jgi:hypothetical protein